MNACPRCGCAVEWTKAGTVVPHDRAIPCELDLVVVARADLEALFRDSVGNLVPPSGRGAQSTSQTNRYFALKRLFIASGNRPSAPEGGGP